MMPRKRLLPNESGLIRGGFGPGASNFSSANSNLGSNHSLLISGLGGGYNQRLADPRHLMMSSDADHPQFMNPVSSLGRQQGLQNTLPLD